LLLALLSGAFVGAIVAGAIARPGGCLLFDGQLLVAGSRGNHRVVVSELAQNVTPGREMASNPTTSLGIEFGDVDDLQAAPQASKAAALVSGFPPAKSDGLGAFPAWPGQKVSPFAALAARHGRPLRVAILSDFTRIPYANGAVFQTRFLYQELRRCGHEVTVIGPHDPDTTPAELAPGTVELPSLPLKSYPGVYLPMPLERWVFEPDRWNFDICFAQTTTMLLEFGLWLREMKGVPLLCVNTTHLVAAYDVLFPEKLSRNHLLQSGILFALKRPFERLFSGMYNQSDGLVVLSEGLRTYWRERGVTVPIHVIPRAVQPDIFDRPLGPDPYTHLIEREGLPQRGPRLLCAGRHTREKSQDRVIGIFAKHILPREPDATLTMVGEGPNTPEYKRLARELGAEHRIFFTGEVPWTTMPDFYRYADLFMHASLSETYGNVLGEALWCGTPTVAFADGMGVSAQIQDGVDGLLFAPGEGYDARAAADAAFGRAAVALLGDPRARGSIGTAAAKRARERCSPNAVQQRIADAFHHAQDHAVASALRPMAARSKAMQWVTTARHVRPWTTFNGLMYVTGHMRPAPHVDRQSMHPSIGS
jgi:glycosyltransferase involved in cell wall biosynthesis